MEWRRQPFGACFSGSAWNPCGLHKQRRRLSCSRPQRHPRAAWSSRTRPGLSCSHLCRPECPPEKSQGPHSAQVPTADRCAGNLGSRAVCPLPGLLISDVVTRAWHLASLRRCLLEGALQPTAEPAVLRARLCSGPGDALPPALWAGEGGRSH